MNIDGHPIVAISMIRDIGKDAQQANNLIIAAAPELLAALIEMEREKSSYMKINNLGDPAVEHTNKMARAAIAKATGSQP